MKKHSLIVGFIAMVIIISSVFVVIVFKSEEVTHEELVNISDDITILGFLKPAHYSYTIGNEYMFPEYTISGIDLYTNDSSEYFNIPENSKINPTPQIANSLYHH